MKIQPNTMVTVRYTMEPVGDEAFPYPKGPFRMEALVGHGRLLPGLERALMGATEGAALEVVLEPEDFAGGAGGDAYLLREDVVEEGPLEVGAVRHTMDENRCLRPFRILAVDGDRLRVDFSHPFAGRAFRFRVVVERVRWASLEELRAARTPVQGGGL